MYFVLGMSKCNENVACVVMLLINHYQRKDLFSVLVGYVFCCNVSAQNSKETRKRIKLVTASLENFQEILLASYHNTKSIKFQQYVPVIREEVFRYVNKSSLFNNKPQQQQKCSQFACVSTNHIRQ